MNELFNLIALITFAFIDPPLFNVGIRLGWKNCGLVGQSAEIAPSVHVGKLNLVVIPVRFQSTMFESTVHWNEIPAQMAQSSILIMIIYKFLKCVASIA